jgi:hypothetical protein
MTRWMDWPASFGHQLLRADDGTPWFIRGGGLTRIAPVQAEDFASICGAAVHRVRADGDQQVSSPAHDIVLAAPAASDQLFGRGVNGAEQIGSGIVSTAWIRIGRCRDARGVLHESSGSIQFRSRQARKKASGIRRVPDLFFTIQPAFYQTGRFKPWPCRRHHGHHRACGAFASAWSSGILAVLANAFAQRECTTRCFRARRRRSATGTIARTVVRPWVARHQLDRVRRQVETYVREARESIKNLRSPLLKARGQPTALQEFGRDAAVHVGDVPSRSHGGCGRPGR